LPCVSCFEKLGSFWQTNIQIKPTVSFDLQAEDTLWNKNIPGAYFFTTMVNDK
jgi:hypothetical protein